MKENIFVLTNGKFENSILNESNVEISEMHLKGVELTKQKPLRYCSDNTCTNLVPICCLFITSECSDSHSKWVHLSAGEHVCSHCHNQLHSHFSYETESVEIQNWKESWLAQAQDNPTIMDYIGTELLPNWLCCAECGKWRQINRDVILSSVEISRFHCRMIITHRARDNNACEVAEDQRIEFIRSHPGSFFESVKYPVFLSRWPRLDSIDEFQWDAVGVSPTAVECLNGGETSPGFLNVLHPFRRESAVQPVAGAIDATSMDKWEYEYFPSFTGPCLRSAFIGLRNLMLLLWAADPLRAVTVELMNMNVYIRGLMRVALLINSVPDLIKIYSGFGYINFGFPHTKIDSFEEYTKKNVVVVGAGLSGLAAAHHLHIMGNNVTLLEREPCSDQQLIKSDHNNRLAVKRQIYDCLNEVHGIVNNPFSVIAQQCGIELKDVSTNLSIFSADGVLIDDDIDQFYQNLVYNFVGFLMEGAAVIKTASAYRDWTIGDLYRDYRKSRIPVPYLERADYVSVENVYLAEIEYRISGGTCLDSVSRLVPASSLTRGVFNFSYRQFSGATAELVFPSSPRSWSDIITQKMSHGIDVRYSSRVQSISRAVDNNDRVCVRVESNNGTETSDIEADHVLFAIPSWRLGELENTDLWLTRRSLIEHNVDTDSRAGSHSLSRQPISNSQSNDDKLTFFMIQLAFREDNLFWRKRLPSGERAFAIAPHEPEWRGFCHLFKESPGEPGEIVLTTRVFGDASRVCCAQTDENIINMVIEKMACLVEGNSSAIKPSWTRVLRLNHALLACSDDKHYAVAEDYRGIVSIKSSGPELLSEPINLTNSFCVGMDAASSLLRNLL